MDEQRIERRRGRAAWALLATLALAGCLSRGAGRPSGAPDREVILRDQMLSMHFIDAYQAVETLHSNWLRPRGPDSINSPGRVWVYYDGVRVGGVEALRTIPVQANGVAYIRFYDGVAASSRWGLDHGNGVIFVSSRDD